MTPRYEIVPGLSTDNWYWRFVAANGKAMADGSEGYVSKRNCRRALRRYQRLSGRPPYAPTVVLKHA